MSKRGIVKQDLDRSVQLHLERSTLVWTAYPYSTRYQQDLLVLSRPLMPSSTHAKPLSTLLLSMVSTLLSPRALACLPLVAPHICTFPYIKPGMKNLGMTFLTLNLPSSLGSWMSWQLFLLSVFLFLHPINESLMVSGPVVLMSLGEQRIENVRFGWAMRLRLVAETLKWGSLTERQTHILCLLVSLVWAMQASNPRGDCVNKTSQEVTDLRSYRRKRGKQWVSLRGCPWLGRRVGRISHRARRCEIFSAVASLTDILQLIRYGPGADRRFFDL